MPIPSDMMEAMTEMSGSKGMDNEEEVEPGVNVDDEPVANKVRDSQV